MKQDFSWQPQWKEQENESRFLSLINKENKKRGRMIHNNKIKGLNSSSSQELNLTLTTERERDEWGAIVFNSRSDDGIFDDQLEKFFVKTSP